MARKCFECGKIITGSVVDHYRDNHYGTYLRNGEDKIRKCLNAFAPECGTAEARVIGTRKAQHDLQKKIIAANPSQNDPEYRYRVKMITAFIDGKCEVQTYRKGNTFICDVCHKSKSTGKRLLSLIKRYTVCYDCYNTIKQANPQKRGNKHFYINTPM